MRLQVKGKKLKGKSVVDFFKSVHLPFTLFLLPFTLSFASAAPIATSPASPTKAGQEELEVQIKGQFRGRFLVKKIVAPVTMNLEKLQDFPEDPSQKILLDPLPFSQSTEFNSRFEVKAHAPFWPWIPAIPEPPFLRLTPPKNISLMAWKFEVLNPDGQAIYRQRGTHELPDEFIWEGKDSEKGFAVVDRLYTAQLTLITPDEKETVIQGKSVILPSVIYGADNMQTVELSLPRVFLNGKSDLSPEGIVLLNKVCDNMRERSLTKLHARISQNQPELAVERENALVAFLKKNLHLSDVQIGHDRNVKPTPRGEVAVFWIRTGGGR